MFDELEPAFEALKVAVMIDEIVKTANAEYGAGANAVAAVTIGAVNAVRAIGPLCLPAMVQRHSKEIIPLLTQAVKDKDKKVKKYAELVLKVALANQKKNKTQ